MKNLKKWWGSCFDNPPSLCVCVCFHKLSLSSFCSLCIKLPENLRSVSTQRSEKPVSLIHLAMKSWCSFSQIPALLLLCPHVSLNKLNFQPLLLFFLSRYSTASLDLFCLRRLFRYRICAGGWLFLRG